MKKMLALFLTAIMVFSLQGSLHAAEVNAEEDYDKEEILEQREADKKFFALSDGTFQCIVYSQRVHFLNELGVYEEIDNTLIRENLQTETTTYAWRNARNDVVARFSENTEDGSYPIRIEKANAILEFGFDSILNAQAEIHPDKIPDMLGGVADPAVSVYYADVFPETDMLYSVGPNGVKEFIIIKNANASGVYRFNIHTEGTTLEEYDNRLIFTDSQGEEVLEIAPFFATDSADHYYGEISHTLEKREDGSYQLEISIDQDWLHAEDRVFPIILDPSVVIMSGSDETYDTFVSSLYPNSNYYLDYYLRTGKDDDYGKRRVLLKFDLPSINYAQVISANIRVKKYDGDTPTLKSYRVTGSWSSSGATWNNKPNYSGESETSVTYDSDGWYKTAATMWTKNWLNNAYPNYGIYLIDTNENNTSHWARFYSSDSTYPNRPELVIRYKSSITSKACLYALNETSENRSGYFSDVKTYYEDAGVSSVLLIPYTTSTPRTFSNMKSDWEGHNIGYIHTYGTASIMSLGLANITLGNAANLNLSGMRFALLLSNYSGSGGYSSSNVSNNTPSNFVERYRIQGVKTVVGFNGSASTTAYNTFAHFFTQGVTMEGYDLTVQQAVNYASSIAAIPSSWVIVGGNGSITLP
ncbi:MAG: DNRLRE domain-containing protein [Firmicutes bacterium]|nr:DNRLRE domain-containing protein [Bacillota bacterium]